MQHSGLLVVATLSAIACSGDSLTLPGERNPVRIAVLSGDQQSGAPEGLLQDPIAVRLINALDQPVQDAPVVFEADDGVVSPDTVRTDAQGHASTRWILGPGAGAQSARAYLADSPSVGVSFSAQSAGVARAQLSLLTQPSAIAQSSVPLPQQPRVRVTGTSGEPVEEAGVTVVAALASGGGALRGTTSVPTDASGVARFTDLTLEGADGPYTLLFAAVGLTGVAAPQIELRSGPAPQRSITIVEHTPETSDVGRSVFFRVSISPEPNGTPADSSFFLNASTGESCRGSIFDRTCGVIFNSSGARTVVATLPASDGSPEVASAAVTHVVQDVEGSTRTSAGIGPDPADAGEQLTVFVKVEAEGGRPARGSVVIYLDSGACGKGTVLGQIFELNDRGEGTLRVGTFEPGFHEVRACYTGALGFAPSEDVATVVVVP